MRRKDAGKGRAASRRQPLMERVVTVQRQANLSEPILASGSARRFAAGLDRRQEQSRQHTDNGQDHQQFDKRKSSRFHLIHDMLRMTGQEGEHIVDRPCIQQVDSPRRVVGAMRSQHDLLALQ